MKTLTYFFAASFLFLMSCKDEQDTILVAPTDPFLSSKNKAALIAEKQAIIMTTKPSFTSFQQVTVAWGGSGTGINYSYTFDENENLREVKDTPQTFAFTFLRDNDILTRQFENRKDVYTLNSEQLATEAELNIRVPNGSKRFFFYKDGHRVATVGNTEKTTGIIEKSEFSTTGNLLKRTFADDFFEENILNYEYTDFPNTIHQEVLDFQLLNINPRTVNLGKFNTNLIKRISIEKGLMAGKTIEFDYEFDAQNRVSKVNIIRDGIPITLEYQY